MKLDHVNITAPRDLLEREKLFFCEVLGLSEGPRPGFGSFGYWLYDEDQAIVHLSERSDSLESDAQGYFDHVAFSACDLPALLERLDTRGVEYRTARIGDRQLTQVFFRAPSNTRIEVNFCDE